MKTLSHFKRCAIAVLIAVFGITATWAQGELMIPVPTAEEIAAQVAYELKLQQIAAVTSDRYTTISNIVATWEAQLGASAGWRSEFTAALEAANDERLAEIKQAATYDGVRAFLQGRDAPVQLEGVIGTETLGSLTSDLVFTPVVPCRIFDTRYDNVAGPGHSTGVGGSAGSARHYQVYGSAAALAHQGHNQGVGTGPGCPAPQGEPVGIHGNFTADPFDTPTGKKGNIRVYPYLGVKPLVSLVNYETAVNIANTASVGTCYLCSGAKDLSVTTTFFGSDQIGDVMGYYYPVNKDDFQDRFAGSVGSVSSTNYLSSSCQNDGGSVSIYTPGPGFMTVQAEVLVRHVHTLGTGNHAYVYLDTSPSFCPGTDNSGGFYQGFSSTARALPTDSYYDVVTVSRRFQVGTIGTKTYYVNGSGSTTSKFYWLGKSATFHPQP